MPERQDSFTPAQRRAIAAVDRSVLVSAAAGSGKTTVLAERCAALLCDLPPDQRCGIDELLVVTFTDAAAGEMKSRIGGAIRKRLGERPNDRHLQQQLHLLDSASISTIHAFCKTLILRWFPQAGIDPQSTVLSGEEAGLLREEILDALFTELYVGREGLPAAFQTLVDEYGAGDDRSVSQVVLQVHEFISSLPDPQAWLDRAATWVDPETAGGLGTQLDEWQRDRLKHEIALQGELAKSSAATIRQCWPIAGMHAEALEDHVENLSRWYRALITPEANWETVAAQIRGFAFERAAARPRNLSDHDKAIFEAAKACRDRAKDLFFARLKDACCLFTAREYREGLQRIAPHVRTITQLVREFEKRYRAAKSAQAALDFNDLQRLAYRILAKDGDPQQPTEIARQLQRQYRYVLVDEFQDVDPLQEAIVRLVSRESADPPQGNLFAVGDIKQSIYRFRLAEPRLFMDRADKFRRPADSEPDAQATPSGRRASCTPGGQAARHPAQDARPPDQPEAREPLGELIHLQENFRSRGSIVDAVNAVFAPLMSRQFGGSDYDASARLVAGAKYPQSENRPAFSRLAVELHLLEPVTEATRDSHSEDEADPGSADASGKSSGDELELEGIEREAVLIGNSIHQWMGRESSASHRHVADKPVQAGGEPILRPIEYRDIVILLRSTVHKAGPIADVLRRMGIPVHVERDDASMDSTEFRDVLSLLSLLDNGQQDLPLAALLRSPLLGRRFSENDLLEIRLVDRKAPFHRAAARYAESGPDETLRTRLEELFSVLSRYRSLAQRLPLADLLWQIYEEHHYFQYVGGLPDGTRRREHLLRLHDLARQFGRFGKQGLRRFLRFMTDLVESDRPVEQPAGGQDNAVRIMSIHASKGLEFPVVILADLQKTFNLSDTRGTVLLDRELGLGLRAADPERRITYPTLAHQLASERIRRESLSEELRILYVALTRAREHLMLTGRIDPARVSQQQQMQSCAGTSPAKLPSLQLGTASSLLDWILPALGALPAGLIHWPEREDARLRQERPGTSSGMRGTFPIDELRPQPGFRHGDSPGPLFEVFTYTRQETDGWHIPPPAEPERAEALAAFAALQFLPADEPVAAVDAVETILAPLDFHYAGLELTTVPARVSVSEMKRRWDAARDPEEQTDLGGPWRGVFTTGRKPARPVFVGSPDADACARGTATHRFLQLLNLTRSCDAADLDTQCREMLAAGRLGSTEAAAISHEACAWLFATDLGKRIRAGADTLQRELVFVSRINPQDYDSLLTRRDSRDVLLVRGVIDVLLPGQHGLEIVDYKTDAIEAAACAQRAESYRPQLELYARAVSGIYQQKVTARWLVFLHARSIIDLG